MTRLPEPRILYCHCAFGDVVPRATKAQVLARLCEAGVAFEAVPDLCELAARRDPALKSLAGAAGAQILACYPRAVRWLFTYGGAPLPEDGVEILNLRTQGAEAIAERVLGRGAPRAAGPMDAEALTKQLEARRPGQWIPWFPVVDYSRCTGCQQCLSFCLFGVYARAEDGRVEVRHPAHCKTNCPACSRVCPEVAIIFPKYKGSPINGDEVSPDDARREAVRVDPAALLRGDVYATLRQRSQRPGTETDEQRALEERKACACLSKLQEQLGIPADVLASVAGLRQGQAHLCGCDCGPAPQAATTTGSEPSGCACDCGGSTPSDRQKDGCCE